MDLLEGVGESSSPPRSFGSCAVLYDIKNDVYNRLVQSGNAEAVTNPELLREQLDSHFARLPASYGLDINMDRAEDVLLHQKILVRAKDPDNQPAYHVRYLENYWTRSDDVEGQHEFNDLPTQKPGGSLNNEGIRKHMNDFETCSKLEDLNLEVRQNFNGKEEIPAEDSIRRHDISHIPIHEVIFSTIDKPKLLSQVTIRGLIYLELFFLNYLEYLIEGLISSIACSLMLFSVISSCVCCKCLSGILKGEIT